MSEREKDELSIHVNEFVGYARPGVQTSNLDENHFRVFYSDTVLFHDTIKPKPIGHNSIFQYNLPSRCDSISLRW